MSNTLPSELDSIQPSFGLPAFPKKEQPVFTDSAVPFQSDFLAASQRYGVPVNVIMGLAEQESSFNPRALGVPTAYGRAKGIMQYIDSTASRMGINPYDPVQSIDAAAKQLRERLDKGYTMEEAVKAHFAGDDRKLWGPKTAAYGQEVLARAEKFLSGNFTAPAQTVADVSATPEAVPGQAPAFDTQAIFAELNAEEPDRYRPLTEEEMKRISQHLTPELQQDALSKSVPGVPIEINIPDLSGRPPMNDSGDQGWDDAKPEGNEDGNLLTDAGYLLSSGLNNAAKNLRELVGKIPGVGKTIVEASDRADQWLNGENTEELFKSWDKNVEKNLTPEMLAARKKAFVIEPGDKLADGKESTGYNFGPAWSDPRTYMSGIVESLPEMAVTMGGAGRLAQMSYKAAIKKGLSKEAAAKAAARTATVAGGILEGSLAGAQTSRTVRDQILAMDEAQLKDSEALKAIMADGKTSFKDAKAMLAEDAASQAFWLAGVSTGVFGGLGDRTLAKIITGDGGIVKSAVKGAIGEGVLEELPQSVAQQVAENKAMQEADPNISLGKGVANAAASGLAIGGVMGAGLGAIAPRAGEEKPAERIEPTIQLDPAPKGPLSSAVDEGVKASADAMEKQPKSEAAPAADEFMGPVGGETLVVPADDPNEKFNAKVVAYRNGNAVVEDANGERYELGPTEVIRPDAQPVKEVEQSAKPDKKADTSLSPGDNAIWKNADSDTPVVFEGVEPQPGSDGRTYAKVTQDGKTSFVPFDELAPSAKKAAEPLKAADKPLDQMNEQELRDRLKYVNSMGKQNGWDKRLTTERKIISSAIDSLKAASVAQPAEQPADQPVKWFGSAEKANGFIQKKNLSETHEVVPVGKSRFEIREKQQADKTKSPHFQRSAKLVGPEGAVLSPSMDIGPAKAGGKYVVEKIDKDGTVHLGDQVTNALIKLTRQEIEKIRPSGIKWDSVESTVAETLNAQPEQQQQEWQQFPSDSGSLGIPRSDMPQVKAEHRGAMVNYLNARGVAHTEQSVPADSLKPTQGEYSTVKVQKAKEYEGGNRSILISADGYVLDGHHQWMAAKEQGQEVKVIRLDAPITDLIDMVKEFPSSTVDTASAAANQPADDNSTEVQAEKPAATEKPAPRKRFAEMMGNAQKGDVVVFSDEVGYADPGEEYKVLFIDKDFALLKSAKGQTQVTLSELHRSGATVEVRKEEASSQGIVDNSEPAPAAEAATQSAFSGNKIFTADKVAAARERIRSKLGQLNSGIDPEMLVDGMTIAGAYIESGVRKFSEYAKLMTADLGEGVKPYLLSFWEGARNYPGLDTKGMTSTEDSAKEFAALLKPADLKTEAVGTVDKKPATRTRKTGASSDITLTNDWGVDHIDGYGENSTGAETGSDLKTQFLKETEKYLKAVADELEKAGFGSYLDVKGRPRKTVMTNPAGDAVSGDVMMSMAGPNGVGAYVSIGGTSMRGTVPVTQSGVAILYRGSSANDHSGSRYPNRWAPVDLSAADLAKLIMAEVAREEARSKPKQPEAPVEPAKFYEGLDDNQIDEIIETYRIRAGGLGIVRNQVRDVIDKIWAKKFANVTKKEIDIRYLIDSELAKVDSIIADAFIDGFKQVAEALKSRKPKTDSKAPASVKDLAVDGGSVQALVEWIAANSKNKSYQAIASRIAGQIPSGIDLMVVESGTNLRKAIPSSMNSSLGALWTTYENITRKVVTERTLILKGASFSENGLNEETILHELIHAATNEAINQGAKFVTEQANPTLFKAVKELYELQNQVVDYLNKNPDYAKSIGLTFNIAASDVKELVAWGLTNEKFQEVLSKIKVAQGSLWDKFVQIVAQAIGVSRNDENALSQLLRVSGGLFDAIENKGGKTNEPKQLDEPSKGPLAGASADPVQPAESERETKGRTEGSSDKNLSGAEPAGGSGVSGTRSVGNGAGAVSVPKGRSTGPRNKSSSAENAGSNEADARPAAGLTADELPDSAFNIDADAIGKGGAKTKYKNNVAAIRILKQLQAEGRQATRQEQEALSLYVGWGGIPQAFERTDGSASSGWDKEVKELKELLTTEEYEAAEQSTRNAHYTSPQIVSAMWRAVERMGFTGGKLIEPSVGVGNFFGLMPADIRSASALHGVELDKITAGLAANLYPEAKIANMGFQEYNIPDGYFDLAIGNPPFGAEKLYDGKRKHLSGFSIHNYFFARSVDALRPGGVLAMVVTNRFMDGTSNKAAREYIAERANLIGAIRLPNDAFSANAGTEVTTDIIFLQRREDGTPRQGASWLRVEDYKDKSGKTVPLNQYFVQNPNMMLGEFGAYGTMYRPDDSALVKREGQDTAALLEQALNTLPERIMTAASKAKPETRATVSAQNVRVGSVYLDGDKVMIKGDDVMGESTAEAVEFPNEKAKQRVVGMIGIRDVLTDLRKLQLDPRSDDKRMNGLRKKLNQAYDSFVKEFGHINNDANKRLMRDDPTWPQLSALEDSYDKGVTAAVSKTTGEAQRAPSAKKAAIFSTRTQTPYRAPESASSAKDALITSLSETGRVNLAYMSELYSKPQDQIIQELGPLIFQDPTAGWVTRDAYLSGNVKAKLAKAKDMAATDPAYNRNVEALEEVQPKDVEAVDISIKPGASWIPANDMRDFAIHLGAEKEVTAFYDASSAKWSFPNLWAAASAESRFGTGRMRLKAILEAAASQKAVQVYDTSYDGKRTLNETETQLANDKVNLVKEEFARWVWESDDRRTRLTRIYNDMFNTDVSRDYDGSHLTLPGKTDTITLRPHQNNAIWRIIQSGTTLTDHVVGAGKTFTLIGAAMELRRMGLANKPLFAVPNHLVAQWAADFVKLYPGANILAATKRDFEKENRKRLFARIATGDWDAVIVAHSSFGKVQVDPESESEFIREQIKDLTDSIEAIQVAEGKSSRNVKQAADRRKKLEERLKRLTDIDNKDDSLYWSELGIDALFLDEAHEFKNLAYSTSMRNVAGLGSMTGSQKAMDLFMKVRQVLKTTGGRNVVFATGTPISNTMAEMYTMQRYLDYDTLKQQGLAHFDAWARMFGEVVSDWELSPSGSYKLNSRFAKFVNMPELMQRYTSFADVINRDDINRQLAAQGKRLPVPKVKTGKPINQVVDRSNDQAMYIGVPTVNENGVEVYPEGSLVYRAENLPKKAEKGSDNMLKIMSDARKAALDMRLIDPSYPDHPGSKTNVAADNILTTYKEWDKDKGTQLVFIDLSTPKASKAEEAKRIRDLIEKAENGDEAAAEELDKISPDELSALDSDFSVYDDLRQKLIDRGIPAEEIAFIHSAKTDIQKGELFAKVKSGRIRVLFGSTAKMGAGMNVQDRLVALHHLDAPWRPSDLEQREGRIIRQGNTFYDRDPEGFEVGIYRYATKQTLDSRMWQTLESKARFIEQVRKGNTAEREVEDVGGEAANSAEMKAASSGNPLILEEMSLRQQIRKLENERQGFARDQHRIRDRISFSLGYIKTLERKISELESDAKLKTPESFAVKIEGVTYTKRADAGSALLAVAADMERNGSSEREIGKYGDFTIHMERTAAEQFLLHVTGSGSYTVRLNIGDDPQGLSMRLTNSVSDLGEAIRKSKEQKAELESDAPKLQKQLSTWGKIEELEKAKARHAEVLDQLKPKKAEKSDKAEDPKAPPKEDVRYSAEQISSTPSEGMQLDQVQAIADKIVSEFTGDMPLSMIITQTQEELYGPAATEQGIYIKGAYHPERNAFTLIADNLDNPRDVRKTIIHEFMAHYGLDTFDAESRQELLQKVIDSRGTKDKPGTLWPMWDKISSDPFYGAKSEIIQAEEVFAHTAESTDGKFQEFFDSIRGLIIRALRKLGLIKSPLTNTEIRQVIRSIAQGIRNGSRSKQSQFDDEKPGKTPQISTEAFKRWFGDSKIVNESGQPLRMYHGTKNDFSKFGSAKQAGGLIFFTDSPAIASEYSDGARSGYSEMARYEDMAGYKGVAKYNPDSFDGIYLKPSDDADLISDLLYDLDTSVTLDLHDKLQSGEITPIQAVKAFNNHVDEMQSGGNVMPVYIKAENPAGSKENPIPWKRAERNGAEYYKQQGYDAVYVTEADGYALAVFDPRQIKSATGNTGSFDSDNSDIMLSQAPQIGTLDPANPDIRFSQRPANKEVDSWIAQKWEATKELTGDALTSVMPALLHLTPGRTLLTRVGKDIPALAHYADTKLKMDTFRDHWHAITDKLAQRWQKYRIMNSKENSELMDLMHESTLRQVDPSKPFMSLLTEIDEKVLAEHQPDTESYEAAAAKAVQDAERQVAYDELKARFDKLSREAKNIYHRVRDTYKKLADTQEQIVLDNIERALGYKLREAQRKHEEELQRIKDEGLKGSEKDEAIEKADKALANAARMDAWNKRAKMNQFRSEFESNRLAGPYFPLSRFGDYFVTARNKDTGEVEFFSRQESARDQTRVAKELKQRGYDVETGFISKSADLRKQIPAEFVATIEELLKGVPGTEETQDQVWQLFLERMPDISIRKNRIHRKGRAGFEEDALRAFASHMFHGAHQTAKLKYSMALEDLLDEAKRQVKNTRNPTRSGMVLEQANKSHQYVMNPTSNAISQIATQGAFIWYLAQSPAAALLNMAQTVIVGPPKLAAFYDKGTAQGIAMAIGQINRALFDLANGKTFAENSPRVTPEEKAAVAHAYRVGLITRTQSHDVAGIADSGIKYSPIRAKIMAGISWMFHHTERVNREATFLAAYRVAKKKGLQGDNAIHKAMGLTWDIHYDYQNTSRPPIMHSNTGKALLVFRNYSLNMISDLAYTAYEIINPRNAQERREARTQMVGLLGTLAFNAGIRGLPLYGIMLVIAGMFSDDGEDPEIELKKSLLEYLPPSMVGMMMDGVPGYTLGVEISSRIGFGDLWFRSDNMDKEGDSEYLGWLQQVLGAASSITYNMYKGAILISDGYVWRGLEMMLPKMAKDPMKSWRYVQEGVTTKNGDPIVDEVGGWDIFKQAIGVTPARIAEQHKMNSYNMNKQKSILDQRSKLLTDFYKAWKAGEDAQQQKILDKMQAYSQEYPEMAIDSDAIRQSLKRREKYRGQNVGGMNYNPNLLPRLQGEQPGTVYR